MGRPSKGVRVPITLRLPVDLHREAAVAAARRGWTLNDLIAACVREHLGDPNLAEPIAARQNVYIYDDNGDIIGRV